jgi:hypothetical protein
MPYLWNGGALTAVEMPHLDASPVAAQLPADGLFAGLHQAGMGTAE